MKPTRPGDRATDKEVELFRGLSAEQKKKVLIGADADYNYMLGVLNGTKRIRSEKTRAIVTLAYRELGKKNPYET